MSSNIQVVTVYSLLVSRACCLNGYWQGVCRRSVIAYLTTFEFASLLAADYAYFFGGILSILVLLCNGSESISFCKIN